MAVLLVTSCAERVADTPSGSDADGKEAMLLLDISVQKEDASRALDELPDEGTDNDYKVKDFWLLEYDAKGKLVASVYKEVDQSAESVKAYVNLKIPADATQTYRCVMIANTHDASFSELLSQAQTLDGLKSYGKTVTGFDSMYSTGNDLYMNDVAESITNATTSLRFKLHRNVAKLTVKLENASSDVIITSVQVRNVPQRLIYADQLHAADYDGTTLCPTSDECAYTDLPIDDVYMQEGDAKTFTYYLPRNQKGTVSSVTSAKDKNTYAPQTATYVEIYGINTSDGSTLRYRFYPGANTTTDFNLRSNYHYTMPVTVTAPGNATADSRVESFESANCYMYLPTATDKVQYIPINRVNQFWRNYSGTAELTSTTEWTADIIWNDQSTDLIGFCTADGTDVGLSLQGKGYAPISFKVKGKEGNALIGIKKKGGTDYLWSWHLWITSYNPDENTSDRIYDEENGNCFMDRNLGALSNSWDTSAYGFFYQFGRKDPIPHDNINGYDYNNYYETTQNYGVSVNKPNYYIYSGTGSDNWTSDGNTTTTAWNNPEWNSDKTKSFFDPSPSGWHIATYDEMKYVIGNVVVEDGKISLTDGNGHVSAFAALGGHNYSSINGSSSENNSNGGLHFVGERTYHWVGDVNNYTFMDRKGTGGFRWVLGGHRAYGLSIRCVKDKQ